MAEGPSAVKSYIQPFFDRRKELVSGTENQEDDSAIEYEIVGELETALIRLAVPLLGDVKLDSEQIEIDASHGPHVSLSNLFVKVMKLRDRQVSDYAARLAGDPSLSLISVEYASHRREINRLLKINISPNASDIDVVLEDIRTGIGSGTRQLMRLIEVFPRVAVRYGIEPNVDQLQRLQNSRLVTGLSRMRAWWLPAFEKVASGCTRLCFDDSWDVIQSQSPHKEWINQYDNDHKTFMRYHWLDMWFDHSKFAMFGTGESDVEIGLASKLGNTPDPKTGTLIEDSYARRKRLGCPALTTGGVDNLGKLLIDLCSRPEIWEPIVLFHTSQYSGPVQKLRDSSEWTTLY